MAEVNLDVLVQSRGIVRQRITKLCTKIGEDDDISTQERLLYFEKLTMLKTNVQQLDNAILNQQITDKIPADQFSASMDSNEVYEDKIVLAFLKLNPPRATPVMHPVAGGSNSSFAEETRFESRKLKLPQVPLPEYGNKKGENFQKFIRSFEAIVNKHALSDHEKFIYLSKQLSNGPKILVDSLDVDKQSYDAAKELLTKAFDSALNSKYNLIKKLSELKLPNNADPYPYIGEMRTVILGIETNKITLNDVCQYFVWNGLNDSFQLHMTAITNKSKPSLAEINEHIFEATDRYNKQLEKPNESRGFKNNFKPHSNRSEQFDSNAMAVNIPPNKTKIFCVLCSSDRKNDEHYLKNCPVYVTAKNKFDKLRSINACTKCSFKNHDSKNCIFVFKSNCRFCEGPHMSYLCLKSSGGVNKFHKTSSHSAAVSNAFDDENGDSEHTSVHNVLLAENYGLTASETIVLPTFVAKLKYDGGYLPVRIFKDGGSQRTFICESINNLIDAPIVDKHIPLTVQGFNSTRRLDTKSVTVTVQIGSKDYNVTAICVDRIRTKFNVNGIKTVVNEFTEKGYAIADSNYLDSKIDCVNNIDIIFGTDVDAILPLAYQTFGNDDNLSSFINSPIGVLFSGDVGKMMNNLKYLPYASNILPVTNDPINCVNNSLGEVCNNNSSENDYLSNQASLGFLSSMPPRDHPTPDSEGDLIGGVAMHAVNCHTGPDQVTELSFGGNDEGIGGAFGAQGDNAALHEDDTELERKLEQLLDESSYENDELNSETNLKLVEFVLKNIKRDSDGRFIIPLCWNNKNFHLLARNYKLALSILNSNLKKLGKRPELLKMYNQVISDQKDLGIIEKIEDLDDFMAKNPQCSFLAHNGIFKLDKETSKCRIVFLSNLSEKGNGLNQISHNQALLPGPNLNHKITTAMTLQRFDKYLLIFDICKAFLNIKLNDFDCNRLLFLWFNNIEKGDYKVVGYRNLRLSFGLRPSPVLLMLGLYYMLIMTDSDNDRIKDLKKAIYNTMYMDNGGYTTNDDCELLESYKMIREIFAPYQFQLQQFCTNSVKTQKAIDHELDSETPAKVKFFGMTWDMDTDTLSPYQIELDIGANTKRKVLSSLNGVYDVYNIYAPTLLRARLFVQQLQSDSTITWDSTLNPERLREWSNIVKQANATPVISIPRSMGPRAGRFRLIAFTDASIQAYGAILYLKDLDNNTVTYLTARNRLVSSNNTRKMPSLELQALVMGTELLIETYESLTGETIVTPVKIEELELYTDSMVCLQWIQRYSVKFDKLQKLSVFVKNKLRMIEKLCGQKTVAYYHISGAENPSDFLTRPCGYKLLFKSCYFTGPKFLVDANIIKPEMWVSVPNSMCRNADEVPSEIIGETLQATTFSSVTETEPIPETEPIHVVPLNRFSKLSFHVNVLTHVFRFINALKLKIKLKRPDCKYECIESDILKCHATNYLIGTEQRILYPEVYTYFQTSNKLLKDIPEICTRYNLYQDESGVLRIKSKLPKGQTNNPILLNKNSMLSVLLIRETHDEMCHAGLYVVLKELRKRFHITSYFSAVKSVLKQCIVCRKIHEKPIQVNQNSYREFRTDPPKKPYS